MKNILPNIRRIVQVITLLLSIFIIAASLRILNSISPLNSFIIMIAGRTFLAFMLISLSVIGLSLLFGRVFCGWICPFGTLNHFIGYLRTKLIGKYKNKLHRNKSLRKVKYVVLGIIIVTAIFGIQIAGVFDPLSIFTRGTTMTVIPAAQSTFDTVTGVIDNNYDDRKEQILQQYNNEEITREERAQKLKSVLKGKRNFRNNADWVKNNFLFENEKLYEHVFLHLIVFFGLLLLSLIAARFWCNYLCPLGGLLSLFSRFAIFRIKVDKHQCTGCKLCSENCAGACEPYDENKNNGECMFCFNCVSECKFNAVNVSIENPFKKKDQGKRIDKETLRESRRQVMRSVVGGVFTAGILGLSSHLIVKNTIRPPGVVDEASFLDKCIRCGLCVRTCPTNYLQVSLLESGAAGMLTPIAVGGTGYCSYTCNECGQVCPSHAIPNLPLEKKQQQVLALAEFDRSRCLPWAKDIPCLICEEHCPVSPKAIYPKEFEVTNRRGKTYTIQRPFIDPRRCIGCGICSFKCIAQSHPAVNVYPLRPTDRRRA
jgi:MauM/NapG family ferredoxin protein